MLKRLSCGIDGAVSSMAATKLPVECICLPTAHVWTGRAERACRERLRLQQVARRKGSPWSSRRCLGQCRVSQGADWWREERVCRGRANVESMPWRFAPDGTGWRAWFPAVEGRRAGRRRRGKGRSRAAPGQRPFRGAAATRQGHDGGSESAVGRAPSCRSRIDAMCSAQAPMSSSWADMSAPGRLEVSASWADERMERA